ncbi:MAG: hypothetical protein ABI790_04885 [Betaproteobacteria bacterium]
MNRSNLVTRAIVRTAMLASLLVTAIPNGHAQEKVRPEVGKPLQAAQDLMKANKFKDALARVREADAVSGKTPYETYMIERMRASAATGAKEGDTAIKAYEAVIASGKAPSSDQIKIIEALATSYYNVRDYASAVKWGARYFKEGGSGGQIRTLMIQSYFQSGDFAASARESLADVEADERAGRTPSEEKLQLLANSYLRQKNNVGYAATVEKLLNHYPKKSLWANVISSVQKKPGFSDRLALDVYRLQLATGNLSSTTDYMEMAQLSIQAGNAAEGKKAIDDGFAVGALGKGPEADRHKRLRDLAEKRVAEAQKTAIGLQDETEANAQKDGNALLVLGEKVVASGQTARGIALMEAGIRKGGLRRPEDAKLHLGLAQIQLGQKAKGIQTLKSVQGTDGVADLARLWIIFTQKNGQS